ncbi:histidine phosphatase family protein [Marinithermus hydrothermalis]|uniref:Phosphoglycerate mutase n=1 Tax=Marinithermus hydrothermalis (strain DSM 14884 / JCM 11576 / T1) TaxID=869210 RepID=F2NR85_MARHT|nr:histidine phosphatase family protein [Marinithermus hydrothermalis]AEB12934.1 Phosphoglycerate mutase [Marinithermus hydrothermalis DSM 14884]
MIEVWLIRHGETAWNAAGRVQGHADVPLSPAGIGQAFRLAERLKRSRVAFTTLFSSDLRRTQETAQALALALGLGSAVRTDPLLREIHVGQLAGLTREEIHARFPEFVQAVTRDPWCTPRPGGESMAELAGRVRRFLEQLEPGRHLVVTHGGVIRAALKEVLGLTGDAWRRFHVPNTSITRLELTRGEALSVGDAAHLEAWADWLSDEALEEADVQR